MRKTFCDQCGKEVGDHPTLPMRLDIIGNSLQQYEIKRSLELCERCYHGWAAVIKYVSTLDGLKDCYERTTKK